MVERLHRQLKAAICATGNQSWTEALPLVMLGIRSAFKPDIGATPSQLVYGTTLRLSGEFVAPSTTSLTLTEPFTQTLIQRMRDLQYHAPRKQIKAHSLDKQLQVCTHVLVRVDRVRRPLQPAYEGPYKVLKKEEKYFNIDKNGRQDTVSIDGVKVAYLDNDEEISNDFPFPDFRHTITIPSPADTRCEPSSPSTQDVTTTSQFLPTTRVSTRSCRILKRPVKFNDYVTYF